MPILILKCLGHPSAVDWVPQKQTVKDTQNPFQAKKICILDESVIFASRLCIATCLKNGSVSISRHWQNTCRTSTLQSRPCPQRFLDILNALMWGTEAEIQMWYKDARQAVTLCNALAYLIVYFVVLLVSASWKCFYDYTASCLQ